MSLAKETMDASFIPPLTGPDPAGAVHAAVVPPGLTGPIWPAPGWHPGFSVDSSAMKLGQTYAGVFDGMSSSFRRSAQFGVIDNSVAIAAVLAGYTLDSQIANALRIPNGWGPVVGVAAANAITNAIAGIPQGMPAVGGYFIGSLVPLAPVLLAGIGLKKVASDKTTSYVLLAASGALAVWALTKR